MSVEQPLPDESPDVDEIFSERARFYLRHREQIEEWHRLGWEAQHAVDRYLQSLVAPLQELAADRDLTCNLADSGKYRYLHVVRPGAPFVEGRPVIGVCVGWKPSFVLLTVENAMPFVAVQVARDLHPGWKEARDRFMDTARERRDQLQLKHTLEWPVWNWLPAQGEYWSDLDTYTELVLSEVRRYLEEFQPAVDRAARAVMPPSAP